MPKVKAVAYNLSAAGIALQESALGSDSPARGIIETNSGPVDIKQLQDGDPDLAKLAKTNYVEEA